MRSKREPVIVAAMLATAMLSNQAGAETAPAEATPAASQAAPATAQPAQKVALSPAHSTNSAATAAQWKEGFMVMPSVGLHSIQGDSGRGSGPGLRLGLLAGSRMGEIWSLNIGFAFDVGNKDAPDTSDYVFDIGFSPLFHFPLERVEIVAGPIAGVFVDKGAAGAGTFAADTWTYGWTAGANAGVLFQAGSKVRLGGLFNFFVRSPFKSCLTAGGTDTCFSDNLPSQKVLSLSFAALL